MYNIHYTEITTGIYHHTSAPYTDSSHYIMFPEYFDLVFYEQDTIIKIW